MDYSLQSALTSLAVELSRLAKAYREKLEHEHDE